MWINLNGLKVRFRHDVESKITECLTPKPKSEDLMTIGMRAKCSKKDEFSREKGRKVALSKLMDYLNLTREERYNHWDSYRMLTKTPRWNPTVLNSKRIKKEEKRRKQQEKLQKV